MMKVTLMKKMFLTLVAALSCNASYAITHCQQVTIENIQFTDAQVDVKADGIWHLVDSTAHPQIDRKLSILLAAHAAKKKVELIFEANDYPCETQTQSSRLYGIRVLD